MSAYLIAVPKRFPSTSAEQSGIGDTIRTATAEAAPSTTGMWRQLATRYGSYREVVWQLRQWLPIAERAVHLVSQPVCAGVRRVAAYARTETANASPLQTLENSVTGLFCQYAHRAADGTPADRRYRAPMGPPVPGRPAGRRILEGNGGNGGSGAPGGPGVRGGNAGDMAVAVTAVPAGTPSPRAGLVETAGPAETVESSAGAGRDRGVRRRVRRGRCGRCGRR